MGYLLRDIAVISDPAEVSTAGVNNFMTVAPKTVTATTYQGRLVPTGLPFEATITTPYASHTLVGTADPDEAGGDTFYLPSDALQASENLKNALLRDPYFQDNYAVAVDIGWSGSSATVNGVLIRALDTGPEFNLSVTVAFGGTYTQITAGSTNDSLRGINPTAVIGVDLYRETFTPYVRQVAPSGLLGDPVVRLSKTYNGSPVWFDINAVPRRETSVADITTGAWFNPGTLAAYRGTLFRQIGEASTPFYITGTIYTLNGYADENMQLYAYQGGADMRLLAAAKHGFYAAGQFVPVNFLKGAALTGKTISVRRTVYDSAGNYLTGVSAHSVNAATLPIVSTIFVDFSDLLNTYEAAARITLEISVGGVPVSDTIDLQVLKSCLEDSAAFYYVNPLGGWSTINLGGPVVKDVKPDSELYTPGARPDRADVLAVERSEAAVTYAVEGLRTIDPDHFEEFVRSKHILDAQFDRIIIEDGAGRYNPREQSAPSIRYRKAANYGY